VPLFISTLQSKIMKIRLYKVLISIVPIHENMERSHHHSWMKINYLYSKQKMLHIIYIVTKEKNTYKIMNDE